MVPAEPRVLAATTERVSDSTAARWSGWGCIAVSAWAVVDAVGYPGHPGGRRRIHERTDGDPAVPLGRRVADQGPGQHVAEHDPPGTDTGTGPLSVQEIQGESGSDLGLRVGEARHSVARVGRQGCPQRRDCGRTAVVLGTASDAAVVAGALS